MMSGLLRSITPWSHLFSTADGCDDEEFPALLPHKLGAYVGVDSLQTAVQALFSSGGALKNVGHTAGLFNYNGTNYLVATNSAGTTFGNDDVIAQMTGVAGVLDKTDFYALTTDLPFI